LAHGEDGSFVEVFACRREDLQVFDVAGGANGDEQDHVAVFSGGGGRVGGVHVAHDGGRAGVYGLRAGGGGQAKEREKKAIS
jgi:hypothetical protein